MSMTRSVNLEQVAALAAQLPRMDRLRLVERIVHELAEAPSDGKATVSPDWMSLQGIAPDLLGKEDAQAWVSRTRRESDEQRGHLEVQPVRITHDTREKLSRAVTQRCRGNGLKGG